MLKYVRFPVGSVHPARAGRATKRRKTRGGFGYYLMHPVRITYIGGHRHSRCRDLLDVFPVFFLLIPLLDLIYLFTRQDAFDLFTAQPLSRKGVPFQYHKPNESELIPFQFENSHFSDYLENMLYYVKI